MSRIPKDRIKLRTRKGPHLASTPATGRRGYNDRIKERVNHVNAQDSRYDCALPRWWFF